MKKVIKKRYIFILLILISIGFAYLTSNLSLSGISSIFRNTWDVHFENVVVSKNSVEAETPVIDSNRTQVTFSVELDMPGDFYEFTVDAVNGGTIDSMLDTYTMTELTEEELKYLEYTVTYLDGENLAQYQELNAGDILTYKIKVEYKKDIEIEDLPEENHSLTLSLTTNYIQADENRIERSAEIHSLYNVLKNEAESGGLARKYTGEHQDSMDASKSTKDIYHWYADNDTDGTAVTNKNNVVFANHCWQMIRTTDTGGTRLIYNGEVNNNQCLDTRSDHPGYNPRYYGEFRENYYYGSSYEYIKNEQMFKISGNTELAKWNETTGPALVGKYTCKSNDINNKCSTLYYIESYNSAQWANYIPIKANMSYDSIGITYFSKNNPISLYDNTLAYVGYMYNKVYKTHSYKFIQEKKVVQKKEINYDYWFANDKSYTGAFYSLSNPYRINNEDDLNTLIGKYTFFNNNDSVLSSSVYYIIDVIDTNIYYIEMKKNQPLESYNYSLVYGESYTKEENNNIKINDSNTINLIDWVKKHELINQKYVCTKTIENSCEELMYINSTTDQKINYSPVNTYFNDVNYINGNYINNSNKTISSYMPNSTDIKNKHYTCLSREEKCSEVAYIIHLRDNTIHYISLNDGKKISDAINEMLYDNNVNKEDSLIKVTIDMWYEKELSNYSKYIENTIYCNNRMIKDMGGWDSEETITRLLYFNDYEPTTNLKCEKETDMLSKDNPKARLKYNIAPLTRAEAELLNNNIIRKANVSYLLLTPRSFFSGGYFNGSYIGHPLINSISSQGSISGIYAGGTSSIGIRPSISLKSGTFYTSGNGSMETPYIIETN